MQACLDIVLPYVHERQQFGQAIGEFQLIQARHRHLGAAMLCMMPVGLTSIAHAPC